MSCDDPRDNMFSPTDSIFAEAVDTYLNDHDDDGVQTIDIIPSSSSPSPPPVRRPISAARSEDPEVAKQEEAKMQEVS